MEDAMDIDIDVLDIPEPTEAELEAMNVSQDPSRRR